jgi:hypothetical protein
MNSELLIVLSSDNGNRITETLCHLISRLTMGTNDVIVFDFWRLLHHAESSWLYNNKAQITHTHIHTYLYILFVRKHKNRKRAPCLANPQPEDKTERTAALIGRAALPVGVYNVICIFFSLYLVAVL